MPWSAGAVMLIAGTQTLKTTFDQCTSPASAAWSDQSFLTTSQVTLDPILFTDQSLGRTFVSQLLGKASAVAYTDNDGLTWTPTQGAGINSGVDHQTMGGGPFPASGLLQPVGGYPHAVYYCSQDIAYASCAVSVDGGLTFGPAVPIYTLADCGGLHGHVKVGADGTAYVPNKNCNGQQAVVVSTDGGLTWTVRRVPGSSAGDSDPSLAVATDGTLYLGWADGGHHPMVAVSYDRGATWTAVTNVGTPAQGLPFTIENVAFPAMVAGDGDRALPSLDVESLSIAEPSAPNGTEKLTFTLKVKSLQTVLPGNTWMILWNRPHPDALADRNYVAVRATGVGTVAYKVGKISPPNLNQATDSGDADAGSASVDGTITITIDASRIDNPTIGQDLSGLEVRAFAAHASGLPANQAASVDHTATATYTLVGSAGCQNGPPVAGNNTASTSANAPVAVNVLADDSDPDGDPLHVVSLSAPAHGTVVSKPDGRLTYMPKHGFTGTDSFTYTISDGKGHTAVGRVTISVR